MIMNESIKKASYIFQVCFLYWESIWITSFLTHPLPFELLLIHSSIFILAKLYPVVYNNFNAGLPWSVLLQSQKSNRF